MEIHRTLAVESPGGVPADCAHAQLTMGPINDQVAQLRATGPQASCCMSFLGILYYCRTCLFTRQVAGTLMRPKAVSRFGESLSANLACSICRTITSKPGSAATPSTRRRLRSGPISKPRNLMKFQPWAHHWSGLLPWKR